jgi:hypothetical protein
MPEIIIEEPQHRTEELEKIQGIHNLLFEYVFEVW